MTTTFTFRAISRRRNRIICRSESLWKRSVQRKAGYFSGCGRLARESVRRIKNYVEQQQIPVAHTLLGLGGFPADHPLFLGMAGMHGTYAANMALYESDLLISIGARFDDRVTGNLKHFAKYAKVAHIDIDPAEIGKNVHTHIPVVGDSKLVLTELIKQNGKPSASDEWKKQLAAWKTEYPLWYEENETEGFKPQKLIEYIHRYTKGEAIVTTDVGQHQMWAAQFYQFQKPTDGSLPAGSAQWASDFRRQSEHSLRIRMRRLYRYSATEDSR